MTRLFLGLIAFDLAAMVATLAMIGRMAPLIRKRGIGRILFFALLTLKLFVAGVFGWFVLVIAFPHLPLRAMRNWVYLGLIVYEGAQAVGVVVALWRWRRQGRPVAKRGGIPDV